MCQGEERGTRRWWLQSLQTGKGPAESVGVRAFLLSCGDPHQVVMLWFVLFPPLLNAVVTLRGNTARFVFSVALQRAVLESRVTCPFSGVITPLPSAIRTRSQG